MDGQGFKRNEKIIMGFDYSIKHRIDICNKFLESCKDSNVKYIYDFGPGNGEFSKLMLDAGFYVTAIGNELEKGVKDLIGNKSFNFENRDLNDPSFFTYGKPEAIFASHVVEHLNNPFDFLQECNDRLPENGLMCVIVPPFKDQVVDNHLFVGWNVGYLMSLLLRCGFNVRDGKFRQVDYNVAAIVKKGENHNFRSDIALLSCHADLFPEQIEKEIRKNKEWFNGAIGSLNW